MSETERVTDLLADDVLHLCRVVVGVARDTVAVGEVLGRRRQVGMNSVHSAASCVRATP